VFSKPEIRDLFKQYELVDLYTDRVPSHYIKDPKRQEEYAEVNRDFQAEAFGDARLPLYVILQPLPDGDKIQVVDTYREGKINSPDAFADWLKKHVEEERAQAQAGR
jgi:hypothetical protein